MRHLIILVYVGLLCDYVLPQVIIHVSSTGKNVPECMGNVTQPCLTLEYVAERLKQTTDKIEILVDTDIHLHGIAIFQSLQNITISGEGICIECACNVIENVSENCGMLFENSSNIEIDNITISNCSYVHNTLGDEYLYRSAIVFNASSNISASNLYVQNSYGYGVVMTHARGYIDISNSHFINSGHSGDTLLYGGAGLLIYMTSCPLANLTCSSNQTTHVDVHIEKSSFIGNTLELINQSSFWPLSYGGGLSVIFHWGTVGNTIELIDADFIDNKASSGGGAMVMCYEACYDNKLLLERVLFKANSHSTTPLGGDGLSLGLDTTENGDSSGNNFTIVSSTFMNNYGVYGTGTLVFIGFKHDISNSASNTIVFTNCTYTNNTASTGAAVEILPDFKGHLGDGLLATPIFDNCVFLSNSIKKQHLFGSQYPYSYYQGYGIFLLIKRWASFTGNTVFEHNDGSALFILSSHIHFIEGSNVTFAGNYADKGGAITIVGSSVIHTQQNTYYSFVNNYAFLVGGAIYVLSIDEQTFITSHVCFFAHDQPLRDGADLNITFKFDNNTAGSDLGNSMFMTSIDSCRHYCSHDYVNDNNDTSNPFNGSCIGKFIFTSHRHQITTEGKAIIVTAAINDVVPGREYLLPIKAVDDLDQDVTKIMVYESVMTSESIIIGPAFTFVANNTLQLYGEPGQESDIILSAIGFHGTVAQIPVRLAACPPGYVLSTSKSNLTLCACSASAAVSQHYSGILGCEEEYHGGVAMAVAEFWVGYITNGTEGADESNLYTCDCPSGFCKNFFNKESNSERYPLLPKASKEELEKQVCTENRTGIMCSKCKDGFSVYYHSPTAMCGDNSKCNLGALFYILSELFPITLLFIVILCFNISLTSGTAYSIIFMVQILQAMIVNINGAVRLKPVVLKYIYTLMYNSLNIDFFNINEFSFCLWAGAGTLDMLAMKYVSVAFSIILIGLFVFFINHCNFLIKKFRRGYSTNTKHSAVQGFTAFIVICYFQCARITFLLLNQITPKGIGGKPYKTVVFWDGNITYFSAEHFVYATPAIFCLVVIVIPFPLILFLDSLLIKIESVLVARCRFVRAIRPWTALHIKVKPLLDSFQGCFKDKYRFFAGLFYIYRIVILAVLDLSSSALQFYFLLEVMLVLMLTIQAVAQPFQEKRHNRMATAIFCNLAIINALTVRTYLVIRSGNYGFEAILLQWIQLILIYLPLILAVMWGISKVYKYMVKQDVHQYMRSFSMGRKQSAVVNEYDNIDDDDFPEELFNRDHEI